MLNTGVINMEYIKREFDKIIIEEQNCSKGKRYFDPIRKIFVSITPEELIRQKMIRYMIDYMSVPFQIIGTEEHLSHFGVNKYNGRMDIVIKNCNNNEVLTVIECKSERVFIESSQAIEQVMNYSKLVKAKYFCLVNGVNLQFYHISNNGKYSKIQGIPKYEEIIHNTFTETDTCMEFKRLEYCDYFDYQFLENQEWYSEKIGEDTEKLLVPAIIALDDCLLDCSQKLTDVYSKRVKLIEDLGVQYREYDDGSGGGFGSGYYRIFLLEDMQLHDHFLCGFSISTTGKTVKDYKYGTTDGKSVLILMYNNGDVDEMSAQINLNKFLIFDEEKMTITIEHNGVVTRKGANKKELFQYIKQYNTNMVNNNRLKFGTVSFLNPLSFSNVDVICLFSSLIEYCLYREEYKLFLSMNKQ